MTSLALTKRGKKVKLLLSRRNNQITVDVLFIPHIYLKAPSPFFHQYHSPDLHLSSWLEKQQSRDYELMQSDEIVWQVGLNSGNIW